MSSDAARLYQRPSFWLAGTSVLLVLIVVLSMVARYVQIQRVVRFIESGGGTIKFPDQDITLDSVLGWGRGVELTLGEATTDADVRRLCELLNPLGLDSVGFVNLDQASITDDSIEPLGKLSSLTGLVLSHTPVTGNTLDQLADTKIEVLFLNDTEVDDAALAKIAELHGLTWLTLDSTQITDAGLLALKELPRLRDLSVSNTYTTEQVLSELAEVLPDLSVSDD